MKDLAARQTSSRLDEIVAAFPVWPLF